MRKGSESLRRSLVTIQGVIVCDVSDREECLRLYEETKNEKISVLVNCAGFGAVGSFDELPLDTELKMIDTNVTAVHMLTKLFLKDFVAADRGYIMNIASSAGAYVRRPHDGNILCFKDLCCEPYQRNI